MNLVQLKGILYIYIFIILIFSSFRFLKVDQNVGDFIYVYIIKIYQYIYKITDTD